ncbi:MAG: single-stranded DNA-binding protein [Anaerolineae bacterium]|nr:single-stranded DNA-binding protein [Anaerolineae bacterium]
MAGYQYTVIIGNVGREPEMRYTQSGVAVCDFSVAVSRNWTDRNTNERREETTWFKVSAWRGLAETVNQYVHKGMQIMVAGRVTASAYIGQDGEARASLEITAQDIQFLGRRGEAYDDGGGGQPSEPEDLPF